MKRFLMVLLAVLMMTVGAVTAFAWDWDVEDCDANDVDALRDILQYHWNNLPKVTKDLIEESGDWPDGRNWLKMIEGSSNGDISEPTILVEWDYMKEGGEELSIKFLTMVNLNLTGTLDVSAFHYMMILECYNNDLTGLILPDDPQDFSELDCRNNLLTDESDIENLPEELRDSDYFHFSPQKQRNTGSAEGDQKIIDDMKARFISWRSFDVGTNDDGRVIYLDVRDSEFPGGPLDLSGLTELEYLSCSGNRLTDLILSNPSKLAEIDCSDNNLTGLDLSACKNLRVVKCARNDMKDESDVKLPIGWYGSFDFGEQNNNSSSSGGSEDPGSSGGSDDPTVTPDDPTVTPDDPTVTPDDPTVTPDDPPVTPDDPPVTPDDPSVTPDDPSNPNKPGSSSSTTSQKSEKSSAKQSSNTQAEERAQKAIEAANKAMAAAESGASAGSSRVQSFATAAGNSVPAVSVKLYGFDVSLSVDMMRTLAQGSTGLNVNLNNGAAQVLIPAGFTMPSAPGVLGYDLAYQKDPMYSYIMKALVKNNTGETETHCLGGGELPVAATVTLKTKLTGTVNVYRWDAVTRKVTFVGTGTAENGKVTFAIKQLGNLIVTDGTI